MVIDPQGWVAPTAVLSGEVSVRAHSRILHGAILTADGGPVTLDEHCVVMEGTMLRGTAAHPLSLGNYVLVAPTLT
jgi:carbonic anhydrase/acetyltransferase-like protein (isoleucine patch superfamily)